MKQILKETTTDTSDNSNNIAALKKQFPQCFDKHGAFMLEKFNALISSDSSGLSLSKEGYSLNWLGKSYARVLANEPVRTFLTANTAHNQLPDNINSKNILIKGDNLEVLKHLKGAYSEAVKMIYIDPPYNTGSDGFVYNDDRQFTVPQLCQLAGISETEAKRILEFTSNNSNSHSAWLTFIYPRLYIARQLLRDDGVIFISIDDNEQAQLKILCDEVFGEENFVAQFPWRKRTAKSDVPFGVSQDFEWLLCYAKADALIGVLAERKYYQTDDYPNDRWRLSDLTKQTSADERPNSAFDMLNPKNKVTYPFNPNRTWAVSQDTFQEYYDKGKIVFPDDYGFLRITIPAYRVFESEDKAKSLKKYASETPMKAISTLLPKEIGMSEDGNEEMVNLFGYKAFSFPKPTRLIKYIVGIMNDEDAIILDFFAGSGTTAQAVMELNAEDNGQRQFVCVQIDEATKPKSEAYTAGYTSIFDITRERIIRAAAAIKAKSPLFSGDLGFKQFETTPVFEGYLDEAEALTETLTLFDGSHLSNTERQTLLQTWSIHDGLPLHAVLSPVDLAGYTAYQAGDILYFIEPALNINTLICLLETLDTTDSQHQHASFAPRRLVLWPHGLDSKVLREFSEAIKHYNNRKGIVLSLEIRY